MQRRRNKSHKVPNVKLRPARLPKKKREELVEEDELNMSAGPSKISEENYKTFTATKPFKGVVLCITGIEDKQAIYSKAKELGATHSDNFTDKVTHLVAISHGGAKYTCALERQIPILTPTWVIESYETWLRGDDLDLEQTMSQHRIPLFSSLVVCTSGINGLVERTRIGKLVKEHGGTYIKDFEGPLMVTHLLCASDEGDRIEYAEKLNRKKNTEIKIIWEEWLWDCLEFRGRFDEKNYSVHKPRPKRRIRDPALGKPHRPKLIPVPSTQEDEDIVASVNRVPTLTLKVWESLLRPRGYELTEDGSKLERSPSKSHPPPPSSPPPEDDPEEEDQPPWGTKSLITSFRRTHSFAPPKTSTTNSSIPFRRLVSEPGPTTSFAVPSSSAPSFLEGLTFRLLGEAKVPQVRLAIESAGGKVLVSEDDEDVVDYVIVRLVSGSKLYRAEEVESLRLKYRTDCWLEECIFQKRVCEADRCFFRPLGVELPVPGSSRLVSPFLFRVLGLISYVEGAEKVMLSLSGLEESTLIFTKRLLLALGITLSAGFTKAATHLLCPSASGAKYDKALEWGTPVVSMAWLEEVAEKGEIVDVEAYLVGGPKNGNVGRKALAMKQVPVKRKPSFPPPPVDSPLPTLQSLLGKKRAAGEEDTVGASGGGKRRRRSKGSTPAPGDGEQYPTFESSVGMEEVQPMYESIRVTYEDDAEERQKLLSLLA